ncbi:MAG: sigma factor-like helix-turn-helix DNA-binding protein [Pirellulales bacterium]
MKFRSPYSKPTTTERTARRLPLYDDAPDPAERIAARELTTLIRGLVAELNAASREVVLLWAEGFTHAEIADVVARPEARVRVTLHRALTRLRAHATIRRWSREHDAAATVTSLSTAK